MRQRVTYLAAALLSSAAFPAIAAADVARVTTDLNMRAGPSTEFPVVTVLPDGATVDVFGCVRGYSWCDVSWQGARGWASANYLTQRYQGSYVPIVRYGSRIDLPIISFSIGTYWDEYYRNRPWYARRDRWRYVWRGDGDRRRDRAERREERQERRAERREDRQERRAERRDRIQELRAERRRELRTERRAERRERIQERRVERRRERLQERRAERRQNRQERRTERRREQLQQRRAESRRERVQQRRIERRAERGFGGDRRSEARGRAERRGGNGRGG